MAATDSVSISSEGTFADQVRELANYVAKTKPEEERTTLVHTIQDALKSGDAAGKRRLVSLVVQQVKDLGDGSDKEIEGFFNLIFAHIITSFDLDSAEVKTVLDDLLHTIASSPSDQTSVRLRVLSNLFNALPRNSALRLRVYSAILRIATASDSIGFLHLSQSDVQAWVNEWSISSEERSVFLKSIADAYSTCGKQLTGYQFSLLYLSSLPPTSDAAKDAAILTISTALRLPAVLDFDPLVKLEAVSQLRSHEIFSLLQIFVNEGLAEFTAWADAHSSALSTYGLDKTQLERKIRLLALTSLSSQYIGHNLPYSKISESIKVDLAEVEKWAIEVIRAGLVSGKLSQTAQTLHVTRSTARTFERAQWEALEERLVAWKAGLAAVLDVVSAAKHQNGVVPQPVNV